jgi:hypothetical protein
MKTGLTIAALFVALASASASGVPPQVDDGPDRGVIAVLRRDGVLMPFAAFRGRSWTVPWPEGLRGREVPVNLESVPNEWWGGRRPEGWHAWLTDGTNQPLTVKTTSVFNTYCVTRLGLRTDYVPSEPPPPVAAQPFPKDGVAVAGGLRVDRIQAVEQGSAEWTALETELRREFDRAEDREISGASEAGWRHPLSPQKRKTISVRLESWYRMPVDEEGGSASYVEAVRGYPPGPDDEGCGLETFFSGWIVREKAGDRARAQIAARLMYCDRVGANYMIPFGKVRLRQAWYWIYQLAGYDNEWYAVAQVSRSRVSVVAEYLAGGGCR